MWKNSLQKKPLARLKRTPQRLAILEYLDGNTSHPSAEDVFKAVSKTYRSMSFATVYNTLNTLAKGGVVQELTIDRERRRYDPDMSAHHHLICVSCGKIVDVRGAVRVGLPRGVDKGFTVFGNHVEFYGCCPACKKQKANNPAADGAAGNRRVGNKNHALNHRCGR